MHWTSVRFYVMGVTLIRPIARRREPFWWNPLYHNLSGLHNFPLNYILFFPILISLIHPSFPCLSIYVSFFVHYFCELIFFINRFKFSTQFYINLSTGHSNIHTYMYQVLYWLIIYLNGYLKLAIYPSHYNILIYNIYLLTYFFYLS